MVLFVVTDYTTDAYGWRLDAVATTDLPTHLHLAWLPDYPPALPKYKTRQGRTYQCGWSFNWAGALCTEQLEPGPTTAHTFNLDALPKNGPAWFAFSECCPPSAGCPSTPPLPIAFASQTSISGNGDQQGNIAPTATHQITTYNVLADPTWPHSPTPFNTWATPTTGPMSAFMNTAFTVNEAGTITIDLYDLDDSTYIASVTIPQPGAGVWSASTGVLTLPGTRHNLLWLVTNNHPSDITWYPVGTAPTNAWFAIQPTF